MSLSTFNSKPGSESVKTSYAADVRCVQAFCLSAVACFIIAAAAYRLPQAISLRPPAAKASIPNNRKQYYVGYAHGGSEEYDVYYNVHGAADALKKADVLFLGGSRMKYSIRDQDLLEHFFHQRHLNYFNLAFGYGEGEAFELAIIRKYHLHPKWVIVDADTFFHRDPSPFASAVMKASRFAAWKFDFETTTSFWVEHALHSIVPYIDIEQWTWQADGVEFRSKVDGTIYPMGSQGNVSEVVLDDVKTVPRADPFTMHLATQFQRDIKALGAALVTIWVPTGPFASSSLVRMANVPLIAPQVSGLRTIDGSHLDAPSARRFCAAVLQKLGPIMDKLSPHGSHSHAIQ